MHNSKKSRTFAPSIRWKDAGVDERTALEMRRTGNCTGGSNPSLSAPSQPRPRPTARPRFAFGGRRFPAAARSPGTNIHLPGPFLSSFKKSLSFSLNFTTNNGWAHEKKKKKIPPSVTYFLLSGRFWGKNGAKKRVSAALYHQRVRPLDDTRAAGTKQESLVFVVYVVYIGRDRRG